MPSELEHLMKVARKRGRYGHQDETMILLDYRHMLRVALLHKLVEDEIVLGHPGILAGHTGNSITRFMQQRPFHAALLGS